MDIQKLGNEGFIANQAVIVTYVAVTPKNYDGNNTFQAVIATNGNETYTILSYDRLDVGDAVAGVTEYNCYSQLFSSMIYSQQLAQTSNVNETGKHVHLLTKKCFSYGKDNGSFKAASTLLKVHRTFFKGALFSAQEQIEDISLAKNCHKAMTILSTHINDSSVFALEQ